MSFVQTQQIYMIKQSTATWGKKRWRSDELADKSSQFLTAKQMHAHILFPQPATKPRLECDPNTWSSMNGN
jgi:hypothetical protein